MKVFLTGSTGFVGKRILQDLLKKNYQVRCVVRQGSEQKIVHYKEAADIVQGDITDVDSLRGKLAGCDAVINLVGIIREFPGKGITFEKLHYEGTVNLLKAAREQGVRRFIQMSALGARKDGKTRCEDRACLRLGGRRRHAADGDVRRSGDRSRCGTEQPEDQLSPDPHRHLHLAQ